LLEELGVVVGVQLVASSFSLVCQRTVVEVLDDTSQACEPWCAKDDVDVVAEVEEVCVDVEDVAADM